MTCAECGCYGDYPGGWIAVLGQDPDDPEARADVIAFCPVCAAREFRIARKTAEGYL